MVTSVRRHYDDKEGKWYFSVVDVIALTTSSTNARNYWKVLKNRFKTGNNIERELVTLCNQLKMKARDGKRYLTDVADAETLTELVKLIPGAKVNDLESYLAPFVTLPNPSLVKEEQPLPPDKGELKGVVNLEPPFPKGFPKGHPWDSKENDAELLVDVYQDNNYIFIEAMVAGVSKENLEIAVLKNKITIRGKREAPAPVERAGVRSISSGLLEEGNKNYLYQELLWTSFSRTISLPCPIQTDKVEASEEYGHLIIKLPKSSPRVTLGETKIL